MTHRGPKTGGGSTDIRDATFGVLRRLGLTRIFGNPGTTEIPLLLGRPDDFEFVMGMHEGAVVSMATGYALASGHAQLVNLHTTPGLGNAANALANARDLHVPLVVLVGQQDRRQLELAPFLSGRALERMLGEYPVWSKLPVRPQDVPGAVARAYHEAVAGGGPALVVVPMGDWREPVDPAASLGPAAVVRPASVDPAQLDPLVELLTTARSPAIVTGPGADTAAAWTAKVELAERLGAPVWHEPFAGRAGFPEDHALFAGHLDWHRGAIRQTLAEYDLVVVIGGKAFQLYIPDDYEPVVGPTTRVVVISEHAEDAHRSHCELAVVAPVAAVCAAVARALPALARPTTAAPMTRPAPLAPPPADAPLSASQVVAFVAERWPADGVLVEESPSSRPELLRRIPARAPLGWLGVANGGLGFGLGGAVGVRMALPERPVLAFVGDGSAMFGIQALWSAVRYGVGVVYVVINNGRYGVMDAQASWQNETPPWPRFPGLNFTSIARGMGCPALRVETHGQLTEALGPALAGLAGRSEPLLIEAVVAAEE
ncbi:MAG: thiamine pyrophosphate-dependent enzyme [Solirubrobacteraceae bacterium]